MATESKQARSATTALIYLTVGALMDVWTVIYYIYLWRHGGTDTQYLWCHGFLFSGLVLDTVTRGRRELKRLIYLAVNRGL